jgi:hypothetical protein
MIKKNQLMQSEFEKQVQQRMEELQLTPSEPVWLNIKEQIRKKRKRRMVIWVPLLFLLLGGGTWSLYRSGSFDRQNEQAALAGKKRLEPNRPAEIKLHSDRTIQPVTSTAAPKTKIGETVPVPAEKSFLLGKKAEKKYSPRGQRDKQIKSNSISASGAPVAAITTSHGSEPSRTDNLENKDSKPTANDSVEKAAPVTLPVETNNLLPVDQRPDSIAAKDSEKGKLKQARNKWVVGIFAGAGSSGISSGLGLLKSMDRLYAAPGNTQGAGTVYLPPSDEKKGIGFSAGLSLKKQLSARLLLVSGLSYNYFSTRIRVGQSVRRDTILTSSFNTVRVDQYYRNSNTGLSDYTNQFHFISIPVGIDFRLFKNLPLDIHAGLSVARLVATNALTYNSSAQVYYKNDAVTKTQVFSNLGLAYGFMRRGFTLAAGPYLQYAVSNQLNSGSSNRHLFSLGGRVELMFNKK